MADYISREAAISEILSEPTDAHYPSWYAEKLKQIPAADVVEVVRCKDCVYYNYVAGFCDHFNIDMYINDYCSDGYRRNDNG